MTAARLTRDRHPVSVETAGGSIEVSVWDEERIRVVAEHSTRTYLEIDRRRDGREIDIEPEARRGPANIVDFRMDPSEAVSAPRVHHQWQPRLLFTEPGISADTVASLHGRGHQTKELERFSSVQVIHQTGPDTLFAASDPSKGGWPSGVRD